MLFLLRRLAEIVSVVAVWAGVICLSIGLSFAAWTGTVRDLSSHTTASEGVPCAGAEYLNEIYYTQVFSQTPERQNGLYLPWGALCYTLPDKMYAMDHYNFYSVTPPLSVWF